MKWHPPSAAPTSGVADTAAALIRELVDERATFLSFIRARTRSGADAEDIFQQALVKASAHASGVRDPERSRAWFLQILRRTLADHHARLAVRAAKLRTFGADTEEATAAAVAVCGCSLGQLEHIRPDYAAILRRVDIDEQPLAAAAEALGISPNNATVRLHRARKALRERLRACCGTESMRACLDCGCDD